MACVVYGSRCRALAPAPPDLHPLPSSRALAGFCCTRVHQVTRYCQETERCPSRFCSNRYLDHYLVCIRLCIWAASLHLSPVHREPLICRLSLDVVLAVTLLCISTDDINSFLTKIDSPWSHPRFREYFVNSQSIVHRFYPKRVVPQLLFLVASVVCKTLCISTAFHVSQMSKESSLLIGSLWKKP